MNKYELSGARMWLTVVVLGVSAGLAATVGMGIWRNPDDVQSPVPPPPEDGVLGLQPGQEPGAEAGGPRANDEATGEDTPLAFPNGVPLRYAKALCGGKTDDVIAMTLWMQERLRHARMSSSDASAEEDARQDLREDILSRPIEGNQIGSEGVEDKYVFAPGVELEYLGNDEGRDDLERPVAERTWIRVTYPEKSRALKDSDGEAIRSIVVGVNISAEGYVLKAGIVGNLDIRTSDMSFDWTGA